MASDTQSKSQPEQQNSDPHGELSDGYIEDLVRFFQSVVGIAKHTKNVLGA
jgi:hypothetical protein